MWINFTHEDSIAQEKLMKLTGKGCEETCLGHHEAPDDRGQPRGLPLADPDGQRRQEQRQRKGQSAQPG